MTTAAEITGNIAQRLKDSYKVSQDVALPGGRIASVAASRTYFSWKGLGILSQHLVIQQIDNATVQDAEELFEAGFRFGKHANWVPLVRGLQFGYIIVPIIVGINPDTSLVRYVSAEPRKHFALFEYPVVVDPSNRETIYFQGKAVWGGLFFSDMKRLVERYIAA
jgi:hypothetical protein